MLKKFLTQGKLFPKAMLPQIQWTQGMVRNTWPYQVSISLWFQTSVQKLPTLRASWCTSTKGICLNSSCIVCSLWFVEFFHYVLLGILNLTDTAKRPFIMGLIFFLCLSFDIFHLAVFFVIYKHLHCQTNVHYFHCLFSPHLWNWLSRMGTVCA